MKSYKGYCRACTLLKPVNDLNLCEICAPRSHGAEIPEEIVFEHVAGPRGVLDLYPDSPADKLRFRLFFANEGDESYRVTVSKIPKE